MSTSAVKIRAVPAAIGRRDALVAAALAAFLGVVMIYGVGFAHSGVIHNASHDVRHSNAFPCH